MSKNFLGYWQRCKLCKRQKVRSTCCSCLFKRPTLSPCSRVPAYPSFKNSVNWLKYIKLRKKPKVSEPFCLQKLESVFVCLFGLLRKSNEASALCLSHLFLGTHLFKHLSVNSLPEMLIADSVLLPSCHWVYDNQLLWLRLKKPCQIWFIRWFSSGMPEEQRNCSEGYLSNLCLIGHLLLFNSLIMKTKQNKIKTSKKPTHKNQAFE